MVQWFTTQRTTEKVMVIVMDCRILEKMIRREPIHKVQNISYRFTFDIYLIIVRLNFKQIDMFIYIVLVLLLW